MIHNVRSFIKAYPNLYPYIKTWFNYLSDIDIQKSLKEHGLCTVFRPVADTVAHDITDGDTQYLPNDMFMATNYNDFVLMIVVAKDDYSDSENEELEYGLKYIVYDNSTTNPKELNAKECAKLLRSLRRQHKFEEVNTFRLGYEQPKRIKKHEFGKPCTRDYQIFRCDQQNKRRVDIAFQMKVCRYVDKYITSHGITNKTNFLELKPILEQYVLDLVQFMTPLCKPSSIVLDKMNIEIEYDEKRNVCYSDLNCEMTVDGKKERYITAYSTTQIAKSIHLFSKMLCVILCTCIRNIQQHYPQISVQ